MAFRRQGDAVRQIASMNDCYGYTTVNCVWSHSNSVPQLADVFGTNSQVTQADGFFFFYTRRTDDDLCMVLQKIKNVSCEYDRLNG